MGISDYLTIPDLLCLWAYSKFFQCSLVSCNLPLKIWELHGCTWKQFISKLCLFISYFLNSGRRFSFQVVKASNPESEVTVGACLTPIKGDSSDAIYICSSRRSLSLTISLPTRLGISEYCMATDCVRFVVYFGKYLWRCRLLPVYMRGLPFSWDSIPISEQT